jgi:hypothetical protein
MGKRAWMKVIFQNRRTIASLTKEGISTYRAAKKRQKLQLTASQPNQANMSSD